MQPRKGVNSWQRRKSSLLLLLCSFQYKKCNNYERLVDITGDIKKIKNTNIIQVLQSSTTVGSNVASSKRGAADTSLIVCSVMCYFFLM